MEWRTEGALFTSNYSLLAIRYSLTGHPLAASVDEQHQDDDRAINHLSAGFRHLHDREHAVQEHDQDDADEGAEITTAPTENIGAADDDGGDRGKEIGIAHPLIGLCRIAGEQHACEARGETAEGE